MNETTDAEAVHHEAVLSTRHRNRRKMAWLGFTVVNLVIAAVVYAALDAVDPVMAFKELTALLTMLVGLNITIVGAYFGTATVEHIKAGVR